MDVEEKNKEKETLHYAKLPYNHLKKKYEKGHINLWRFHKTAGLHLICRSLGIKVSLCKFMKDC